MVTVPPFDRCITLPKMKGHHLQLPGLPEGSGSFHFLPTTIRSLSSGVVLVNLGTPNLAFG
jgi:hypothetical protein